MDPSFLCSFCSLCTLLWPNLVGKGRHRRLILHVPTSPYRRLPEELPEKRHKSAMIDPCCSLCLLLAMGRYSWMSLGVLIKKMRV